MEFEHSRLCQRMRTSQNVHCRLYARGVNTQESERSSLTCRHLGSRVTKSSRASVSSVSRRYTEYENTKQTFGSDIYDILSFSIAQRKRQILLFDVVGHSTLGVCSSLVSISIHLLHRERFLALNSLGAN